MDGKRLRDVDYLLIFNTALIAIKIDCICR